MGKTPAHASTTGSHPGSGVCCPSPLPQHALLPPAQPHLLLHSARVVLRIPHIVLALPLLRDVAVVQAVGHLAPLLTLVALDPLLQLPAQPVILHGHVLRQPPQRVHRASGICSCQRGRCRGCARHGASRRRHARICAACIRRLLLCRIPAHRRGVHHSGVSRVHLQRSSCKQGSHVQPRGQQQRPLTLQSRPAPPARPGRLSPHPARP